MRHHRPLILVSAATVLAFALLATACGGRSPTGVANVASGTTAATTTTQNGLVTFSQCMRSNGVPSFPDPQHLPDGSVKLIIHRGAGTPHFQAAMSACNHLLPQGGPQQNAQQTRKQLANELSFAHCMRSRGVSRFPDPTAQGGLSVEMVQAQGIDVHSPQILRVVQACLPASHGGLTAAKVREALANAGH
jgi:hypothetical protein